MSGTTGTVRTESYLLTTEFQDGQASGSISPQDMRDFIVSIYTQASLIQSSIQTSSYTATATDVGTRVLMNSPSAVNFTVPPFSSVAFPLNTIIEIAQKGAGQVTVVAGAGVTLRTSTGTVASFAQYSVMAVWQETQDVWWVSGERS